MKWTGLHTTAAVMAVLLLMIGTYDLIRSAVSVHANSDLYFIASVYRDLFENGRGLEGWNLPPAPYFFPDVVLLFPAFAITGSLIGGYLVYGAILFVALLGGVFALFRSMGIDRDRAAFSTLLAGLAFVAAMQGAHPASLVTFLPIFHAGSAVVALWIAALFSTGIRSGFSRRLCAIIIALSTAIALSDLFSVFQIFIPIALTTLALSGRGDVERAQTTTMLSLIAISAVLVTAVLGVAGSIWPLSFVGNPVFAKLAEGFDPAIVLGTALLAGCAVLVGRLIRLWHAVAALAAIVASLGLLLAFNPDYVSSRSHTLNVPEGWPVSAIALFASDLIELALHDPMLWLAVLLAPTLCAASLVRMSRWPDDARGARGEPIPAEARVARAFLATTFLFSIGIAVVAGALEWIGLGWPILEGLEIYREGTLRHIQPLYVFPIFALTAIVLFRRRPPSDRTFQVAIIGLLIYATLRIGPGITNLATPPSLPYPDYHRCLDDLARERGLEAGYGDYWTARTLEFGSRTGIEMTALREPMVLEFWVHGMAGFLPPPGDPRSHARYDFIVPSRFPPEQIARRFGAPAEADLCGPLRVMLYDRDEDLAFRNFIRLPALLAAGRALPAKASSPPGMPRYVEEGLPVAEARTAFVEPGEPLLVSLERPTAGDVLEIAYAGSQPISVVARRSAGDERHALELPPKDAATMSIAYLALPGGPEALWDRFEIRSDATASIGHLQVYPDTRLRQD